MQTNHKCIYQLSNPEANQVIKLTKKHKNTRVNACSLNRREVLGRVDPVSSEVNGHGVSQDSGE